MSASLVGSEMCIRDRECDTAIPDRITIDGIQPVFQQPSARPLEALMKLCLLYTSDAADDM
eukprot:9877015-Alexandrium_andersonii.AAC.1